MVSPRDSSLISGSISLKANAIDTGGVKTLEFLVDDAVVGSGAPYGNEYSFNWTTAGLTDFSTHRIYARASDVANNTGYSDTVLVTVLTASDLNVYHGSVSLPAGDYWQVSFRPANGDSLLGDARVAGGGAISDFFWCDSVNFRQFQSGQNFSSYDRQQNQTSVFVTNRVNFDSRGYIVIRNTSSSDREIWVRFRLRRRT
jgi:hypothetical protein